MARVRLSLPEAFPFETTIAVRITDLNYGNHLGNDSMLTLLHEARYRFLRHHGLGELDVDGMALLVVDVVIEYRAEAFAGDELAIEVAVGDFTSARADVFYRVRRLGDGVLVARAKTGVAFLDPRTRRVTAVPERLRALAGETP